MLRFDAKTVFDAIPKALRFEWMRQEATLVQICPAIRHETSANRNELIRHLQNWAVQVTA
jgi:hypothetical protein